jgi:hypothetical protein
METQNKQNQPSSWMKGLAISSVPSTGEINDTCKGWGGQEGWLAGK